MAAVLIFMLVYYKGAGLVADLALVLNLFFLVSVLSVFNFTLTLPSIAGVILTVGMAVDANVIIFERIKEEYPPRQVGLRRRHGRGSARRSGPSWTQTSPPSSPPSRCRSSAAGRSQGFAVTLSVGVVSSMFTAPGGVAADLRLLHRDAARGAAQHRLETPRRARTGGGGGLMKRVIPFTSLRSQMAVLSVALIVGRHRRKRCCAGA